MYDAIFLDCDGVVTDKKAQVDSRVLFEVYRLVHAGKNVAFTTGRSMDWLSKHIVNGIMKLGPGPSEKARIFFAGEYGNRWITFSGGGMVHGTDDSKSVPSSIRDEVRNEVLHFPYLLFDGTKESFISLEVDHGKLATLQAEREAQRQVDAAYAMFSSKYPDMGITRTTYSVDVMVRGVGKATAARRALELVGGASHVLLVGDSPIDLEMGDELLKQGVKFDFYYTGESQIPHKPFGVRKAPALYAEGTLEVLRNIR